VQIADVIYQAIPVLEIEKNDLMTPFLGFLRN